MSGVVEILMVESDLFFRKIYFILLNLAWNLKNNYELKIRNLAELKLLKSNKLPQSGFLW